MDTSDATDDTLRTTTERESSCGKNLQEDIMTSFIKTTIQGRPTVGLRHGLPRKFI